MSVAVLTTLKAGAAPPPALPYRDYVPVASQRTFTEWWLPLALSLGLEYLPLFETGVILNAEDLGPVIRELEIFSAQAPETVPEHVTEQARSLLSVLAALDPADVDEFFIG
ncbi:hypothetical protein [Catenuloplanes japonicus]|uniref:hypothetical protein n=1 Tax=Catenuloplanes japonicus TaxID=33876 RepID=UPI0005272809|nr:hypothetical protein [Catenuloplanes japonicus]